jgi:hypothetical protein
MQHRYLLAAVHRDLTECSAARPIDITTNANFFQLALDERKNWQFNNLRFSQDIQILYRF